MDSKIHLNVCSPGHTNKCDRIQLFKLNFYPHSKLQNLYYPMNILRILIIFASRKIIFDYVYRMFMCLMKIGI
jgi:hypothetical protein